MTGTTSGELALPTATDADDIERFNTIDLTTALQTLANLFNSTTGHDHSGAGKGKPVAAAGIAAGVTITSPHFTTPVIDSGGLTITAGSLAIGTTPAGAGLIRLPNNNAIDWRNAANTNDHTLSFNSSDQFQITTNMTTTLLWDGSAQILQLASNAVPAGGGIIRVPNNKSINWRNAANTADDALNFDASDRLAVTTIAGNVTTTIGAAGGAAAMPTPVEYLTVVINGNARKIAAFNP